MVGDGAERRVGPCRARDGAGAVGALERRRTAVALEDDLARGAKQFAAMKLSAVTIGHSSSSMMGGAGWDEATVAALKPVVGDGAVRHHQRPRHAGGAAGAACAGRSWCCRPGTTTRRSRRACATTPSTGLAPAGHHRYDPGRKWRDLAPNELVPQGAGFAQEVEPLYAQIRERCPADADGVLIAGTGFRCVAILDALEQDLGRPVVSANQASLWHCLRSAGVRTPVEGYGSLLRV